MSIAVPASSNPVDRPWWRERMLWLVLGGPAVVVVASFVTLALAVSNPDPVLRALPSTGAEAAADGDASPAIDPSRLPAQQARNHAATGGK
jgi:uncharacterized protein